MVTSKRRTIAPTVDLSGSPEAICKQMPERDKYDFHTSFWQIQEETRRKLRETQEARGETQQFVGNEYGNQAEK